MVDEFLQTSIGVPKHRIQILRNEDANRLNILQYIGALASNPQIDSGDPILIFFAGYGALATRPAGWPQSEKADSHSVEMLCPYDFVPRTTNDLEGQGIPDVTLGALLHKISEVKGDNIVSLNLFFLFSYCPRRRLTTKSFLPVRLLSLTVPTLFRAVGRNTKVH